MINSGNHETNHDQNSTADQINTSPAPFADLAAGSITGPPVYQSILASWREKSGAEVAAASKPDYIRACEALEAWDKHPAKNPREEFRLLKALNEKIHLYSAAFPQESQSLSALLDDIRQRTRELIKKPELQLDVPKNLHFVWLGKLGGVQQDYIKAWGETNKDYQITIWYDPNALLAHELGRQIKSVALRDQLLNEQGYFDKIIQLQNQAYQAISQSMAAGQTFDQAAAGFMVSQLGASADGLERIRTENNASYTDFIKQAGDAYILADINNLTDSGIGKKYYYQELALRQNLAAVSDIVRLKVLDQHSGTYFDVDYLPAWKAGILSDELNARIAGLSYSDKARISLVRTQLLLEHLQAHFPGRQKLVDAGQYKNYAGEFADKSPEHARLVNDIRAAITAAGTSPADFFQPLGQQQLHPEGIRMADLNGLSNASLTAHAGSRVLADMMAQVMERYRRLEEAKLTTEIDTLNQIEVRTEHYVSAYEKLSEQNSDSDYRDFPGNVKAVDYRKDGLIPGSRATLYVTGPVVLEEAIDQSTVRLFGPVDDDAPHDTLGRPFRQFNHYTEEEMKQSWLADSQIKLRDLSGQIMSRQALQQKNAFIVKFVGSSSRNRAILATLDKLHAASGSEQVAMAFMLQNQLRAYKHKYPGSGRLLAFELLDRQLGQALFSADMAPVSATINAIAKTQPELAARLYRAAFNEVQGDQPGLADLLLHWLQEDPYLKPVKGFAGKIPGGLMFTPTFHVALGQHFDDFRVALVAAQAEGVLGQVYLSEATKSVHLGYRYQELNELTGHSQASQAIYYLKEAVKAARASDSGQSVEAVMLDKFADPAWLRQMQLARLTQIEQIYHRNRNIDFAGWDQQYSGEARDRLNQQLGHQPVNRQLQILLEGRQGLLISETHGSDMNGQRFIIEQMAALKGQGVTTIGLEHLCHELTQPLIDAYLTTGIMSGDLQVMLQSKSHEFVVDGVRKKSLIMLFEQARHHGMKIVALDASSAVRPDMTQPEQSLIYRAGAANNVAVDLLSRLPVSEKFVTVYGEAHLKSHPGMTYPIAGISNRLGLPVLKMDTGNQFTVEADESTQRRSNYDVVGSSVSGALSRTRNVVELSLTADRAVLPHPAGQDNSFIQALSYDFSQGKLLDKLMPLIQEIGEVRITAGDVDEARKFRDGICAALSSRFMMEERLHGAGAGKGYLSWLEDMIRAYGDNQPRVGNSATDIQHNILRGYHRQHIGPVIADLLKLQHEQHTSVHHDVFRNNGLDVNGTFDRIQKGYEAVMNAIKILSPRNNYYYYFGADGHGMTVVLNQYQGQRVWTFFDPNGVTKSFDNYPDFRAYMDDYHSPSKSPYTYFPASRPGQSFDINVIRLHESSPHQPDSVWGKAREGEQDYVIRAMKERGYAFDVSQRITGKIIDYTLQPQADGTEKIVSVVVELTDSQGIRVTVEQAATGFLQLEKNISDNISDIMAYGNSADSSPVRVGLDTTGINRLNVRTWHIPGGSVLTKIDTAIFFGRHTRGKEIKDASFDFSQGDFLSEKLAKLIPLIAVNSVTNQNTQDAKTLSDGLCFALSARYMMEERKHGPGGGKKYLLWLTEAVDAYNNNKPVSGNDADNIQRTLMNQYHRQFLATAVTDLLKLHYSQTQAIQASARGKIADTLASGSQAERDARQDAQDLQVAARQQYSVVLENHGLTNRYNNNPLLNPVAEGYEKLIESWRNPTKSTYISFMSELHAMAVVVNRDPKTRQCTWTFFDPNYGGRSFNNFDDFRHFMDGYHKSWFGKFSVLRYAPGTAPGQSFTVRYNEFKEDTIKHYDGIWQKARQGEQAYIIRTLKEQGHSFKLNQQVSGKITDYTSKKNADGSDRVTSVTLELRDQSGKKIIVESTAADFNQLRATVISNLTELLNHDTETRIRIETLGTDQSRLINITTGATVITPVKVGLGDNSLSPIERNEVKNWLIPAVTALSDGGPTRFGGQIILQLENDLVVREDAAFLAGKHPKSSVIIQLDAQGHYRVVYGDPETLSGPLRWQLVGHGRGAVSDRTLAGYHPDSLAEKVQQLSAELGTESGKSRDPQHVSLVSCALVSEEEGPGYARLLGEALDKQGIRADIAAWRVAVDVDAQGHKVTLGSHDDWQRKISDDKMLYFWNSQGQLVPATDLSVRLERFLEILIEVKSHNRTLYGENALDAEERRILAEVFRRADGSLDVKALTLHTVDKLKYQALLREGVLLLQGGETKQRQLQGLSLGEALQRNSSWDGSQRRGLGLMATGSSTVKVTGVVIKPHLVPQGLYNGNLDAEGACGKALGLAWLRARNNGGDAGTAPLFSVLLATVGTDAQQAAGALSASQVDPGADFRTQFTALTQTLAGQQDDVTRQNLAVFNGTAGDYRLKTVSHQVLMLSVRVENGESRYSLYDPNIGEVRFSASGPQAISQLNNALQAYLTGTAGPSGSGTLAQYYGMELKDGLPEVSHLNMAEISQQLPALETLQRSVTAANLEQHRLATTMVTLGQLTVPERLLLRMGISPDGRSLQDPEQLSRWLLSADSNDPATVKGLALLKQQGKDYRLLAGSEASAWGKTARQQLEKINNRTEDMSDADLWSSVKKVPVPGSWARFHKGINHLSNGMQALGYIRGFYGLAALSEQLKRTDLTVPERAKLESQYHWDLASLVYNISVDFAQLGLSLLGKGAAQFGRVTGVALKGGPVLGLGSAVFDIRNLVELSRELKPGMDSRQREYLLQNMALSGVGAALGLASGIGALLGASAAGPVGVITGLGVLVAGQIYSAVHEVTELKKYVSLSWHRELHLGLIKFFGGEFPVAEFNEAAENSANDHFRKKYDRQMRENAEKLLINSNGAINTVYYSRDKLAPLKGQRYRKLIITQTVTDPLTKKKTVATTTKDTIHPEQAEKMLVEFRANAAQLRNKNGALHEEFTLEWSDRKYYIPGGLEGTDDSLVGSDFSDQVDQAWRYELTMKSFDGLRAVSQRRVVGEGIALAPESLSWAVDEHQPGKKFIAHGYVMGKFNADDHHDIAYFTKRPDGTEPGIFVSRATADGRYDPVTGSEGARPEVPGRLWLLAGDVDKNGFDDIVNIIEGEDDKTSSKIQVRLTQQDGSFIIREQTHQYRLQPTFNENGVSYDAMTRNKKAGHNEVTVLYKNVVLADINGDGHADLVSFYSQRIQPVDSGDKDAFYNEGVWVEYGNEDGQFSTDARPDMINTDDALHYAAGDVNGDGCADVVKITDKGEVFTLLGSRDREHKYVQDVPSSADAISFLSLGSKDNPTPDQDPRAVMPLCTWTDRLKNASVLLHRMDNDQYADLVVVDSRGYYTISYGQADGGFSAATDGRFGVDKNGRQRSQSVDQERPAVADHLINILAIRGKERILGIRLGQDGHQALVVINKDGELSERTFKPTPIKDSISYFMPGDGNDRIEGDAGKKNIFEVAGGVKTFTGGRYTDQFLLLGKLTPGNPSVLDGQEGNDDMVISFSPGPVYRDGSRNRKGYYINLATGDARYITYDSTDIQSTNGTDLLSLSGTWGTEMAVRVEKKAIARLVGIEYAVGHSETNDCLVGDEGDNDLNGAGGSDMLIGNGGNDKLRLQEGQAWGGSGTDTYDIMQSERDVAVTLIEAPGSGENSLVTLAYSAVQITAVTLQGNDVLLSLKNDNGTITTLRLSALYSPADDGNLRKLQHNYTLRTTDGFTFSGWPSTLVKDAQGNWPSPTLRAQYSPALDQNGLKRRGKTAKEIQIPESITDISGLLLIPVNQISFGMEGHDLVLRHRNTPELHPVVRLLNFSSVGQSRYLWLPDEADMKYRQYELYFDKG